ncbi:type VI secretion system protein TssA [Thalassomonas viridans]|uniref:Type VI secretion system protein TssA n=1 Tax=Thalassomonas viridans TaxID=137584 RepID=A0AAE9YZG7_9GAMM|nr:type VI secretion system protein TssA [Thalassomonas viridans]WDE03290.1 type VI secretion system protein TssA [Thalassomonas viridans]
MNPLTLVLDELIQPVADKAPAGMDPRADVSPTSTYYLLKDIRNNARAKERNALVDDEGLLSLAGEWRPVLEQVPPALKDSGKDLEFVAWLIEALCRLHGFEGLAFGFNLATELIERYWQNLYPTPDSGDLSERLAPLIGLNGIDSEGSLIQPIKAILITQGTSEGPYASWQYEQALEVDRLDAEKQQKRFEAGAVSLEAVQLSIKETAADFYLKLNRDVEAAQSAFARLSVAMDSAMAGEPQPTSYISQAIAGCANNIKSIAKDILEKETAAGPGGQAGDDVKSGGETPQAAAVVSGALEQLNSREQAIKNLDQIAAFFRKTEPHSPMSYAIEQVIRWSELSLPELLEELIADGEARNGFFKLSGIKIDD